MQECWREFYPGIYRITYGQKSDVIRMNSIAGIAAAVFDNYWYIIIRGCFVIGYNGAAFLQQRKRQDMWWEIIMPVILAEMSITTACRYRGSVVCPKAKENPY